MRICKNCGLCFAGKGRGTAEYCDADEKGRVCKEIGAFVHWSQNKEERIALEAYQAWLEDS